MIADAIADLGKPAEINDVFNGFQRFLYEQRGVQTLSKAIFLFFREKLWNQ